MNDLIKQAQAAAAAGKLADQTQGGGSFERETPPAGPCFMRFTGYIEVGLQPQRAFQGKEKPPARVAWLEFQLMGKKHTREIEVDGEKVLAHNRIRIKLALKGGDRANSTKLLRAMAAGRDINHFALMLGEAFRGVIVHNDNGKDGAEKRVYANLRNDSGWTIAAPMMDREDPETGEVESVPARVPAATDAIRLLLWDSPTKEQWDSIFIDGEDEREVEGKRVMVSRNWLQRMATEAVDWEGSAVQLLVAESEGDLPEIDMYDNDDQSGLDDDLDDEIPF